MIVSVKHVCPFTKLPTNRTLQRNAHHNGYQLNVFDRGGDGRGDASRVGSSL